MDIDTSILACTVCVVCGGGMVGVGLSLGGGVCAPTVLSQHNYYMIVYVYTAHSTVDGVISTLPVPLLVISSWISKVLRPMYHFKCYLMVRGIVLPF